MSEANYKKVMIESESIRVLCVCCSFEHFVIATGVSYISAGLSTKKYLVGRLVSVIIRSWGTDFTASDYGVPSSIPRLDRPHPFFLVNPAIAGFENRMFGSTPPQQVSFQ